MPRQKQKTHSPFAFTMGYGTQGRKKGQEIIYYEEKSAKTEVNNAKIEVSVSKPITLSEYEHPLRKKYNIEKYDLHPGYVFPEIVRNLIPKGTPEYVDKGKRYVERIVRALYYFKQCALVGPSGTGKTHVVYLVAELCVFQYGKLTVGFKHQPMTFSVDT